MPIKSTLEAKIRYRIRRSLASAYIYADFADLSDRYQVWRVLKKLIASGELIRVGQGVYSRAKKSNYSGKIMPEKDLKATAEQALKKLNVRVFPSSLEKKYNNRETTQIPTGLVIGVKKRVSRKISYNGKSIKYEHVSSR